MKVGNIVESNAKGQIVIPKKIRDHLNITPNTPLNVIDDGKVIYIYPIKELLNSSEFDRGAFLEVLRRTQGAWANENWDEYDKLEKKRGKLEIEAARKARKAW